MNKYSKLFSSLLVVLLMLDIATPALTYAATAELVDEEGVEEVSTSKVTEEETVTTEAVQSAEEKTEDDDQPVVDTPAAVEEQTHPTTQTDAEKLQEENEVTREAMEVAEEEVRKAQGHVSYDFSSYIDSVSYSPTEITAGHMTTLTLSFSEKNGYVFQNGQSLTYHYPSNITGVSAKVPLNYNGEELATCESSSNSVTCTFNESVEKYDNVQGHFTFKATGRTDLGEGNTVAQDSLGNNVTVVTGASGNSTDTFFYKTGVIDDRYEGEFIWDLTVNASETYQPYGDVVIHDTFGPGQELKGDIIVGDLSESQYELTLHENGFTLVLYESTVTLNSVVISYVTKVTEAGKYLDKLTNAYSLKYEMWPGTDVPHESEGKSGVASVENAIASGGITGELPASGIVRVVKLDSNTTERLSGAEFKLYKEDGTFIEKLTTNSEGIAESQKLGSGNYYLEESKAPAGYQKAEEKYEFTINQNSIEGIEKVVLNTPLPKEVCENFTVNTEDGSKVTITDKETNEEFATGTAENGKFVTAKPLEVGKDYTVTVEKDGYKKEVVEVKGSEDNCETTVSLTKTPEKEVCENFTVNTEDGSKVTITDKETNETFGTGEVEDGKFVTEKPLEPGKDYTVTVEKDGYKKEVVEVKGSEDNCEITVDLTEKQVCSNFTVTVKDNEDRVDDATVTIVEKDNPKIVVSGQTGGKGAAGNGRPDGQFVTSPLDQGKTYIVTVEKDGYKKVEKEITVDKNCGMEINISKEENPKEEVCENFTVNTEEGATVTITDSEGKEFAKGTVENGKFTTDKPLEVDKDYTVIVEKDGYETAEKTVTGSEKDCEVTVELTEVPTEEVCENFTVNTEEGATVTITDSEGKEFAKGTVENGKFTTDKPLEVDKEYTVIVEKDGYETTEKTVTGSEDNCEVIIKLIKELGGQTPPTEPEETPGEVVTPENPDEGEGEETPETPEAPGTETPEVPEEKPSTGGGGGGGDPTPEPTPEFPEVPTPEEPEETPDEGEGEETPEVPETPGTETPESTEATIVLTKVDAKNENKVLEGAVFDLYKKDGNVLVTEGLVTNKEGLIKVENLEAGEYYFVERRAPKGYKLNREQHFVTAVAGKTTPITVENKKRPSGGGGGGSTTPTEPETPTTPEEGEGEETPETPEGETETPSETPGEGEETPETPEGETPEVPEGEETPEGETETPSETPEGTETEKDDNKDETPIITDRPNNDKNSTVDSDKRPTTNTDSTQKVEQEKPAVEKGNVLPQTGEATNMFVLFLAGLLIATGSVLVIRRRTA